MSKAIEFLESLVKKNRDAAMNSGAFVSFMTSHRSVFGIVSAALRQGNLTPAILEANSFPDVGEFQVREKDRFQAAIEAEHQVTEFARWLIEAGRKFGFTVLGIAPSNEPDQKPALQTKQVITRVAKKTSRKTAKRPSPNGHYSFRKGSIRNRVDRLLRTSGVGMGLVRFVRTCRKNEKSEKQVAAEIKRLTGIKFRDCDVHYIRVRFEIS